MKITALLLVALATSSAGFAQKITLEEKLAQTRQPIALVEGRLSGAGAKPLEDALRGAQYVLIGEDHGLHEIPLFSTAVFDLLAPAGFRTMVVEVGPTVAAHLQNVVATPDPVASMQAMEKQFPFSTAFYNLREELDLLVHMRLKAGQGFRLVGLDQELMGSTGLILDGILKKHRKDKAGDLLVHMIDEDRKAYAEAAKTGRPDLMCMMTCKSDEFEALRDSLRAAKDPASAALVDSILESRAIYAGQNGNAYESNIRRARLMKRTWLSATINASDKVMFKFGANHMIRGLNTIDSFEIGNLVSEMAEAHGQKSVHILVLAATGKQRRFAGVGRPFAATDVSMIGAGESDFPSLKPVLLRAMETKDEWSLFDLRTLRTFAGRDDTMDPTLKRVIFGFDFAVVIPEGTPSTQIQ